MAPPPYRLRILTFPALTLVPILYLSYTLLIPKPSTLNPHFLFPTFPFTLLHILLSLLPLLPSYLLYFSPVASHPPLFLAFPSLLNTFLNNSPSFILFSFSLSTIPLYVTLISAISTLPTNRPYHHSFYYILWSSSFTEIFLSSLNSHFLSSPNPYSSYCFLNTHHS